MWAGTKKKKKLIYEQSKKTQLMLKRNSHYSKSLYFQNFGYDILFLLGF